MSLKSAPYYWLECDDCGALSTDSGAFKAWEVETEARDEAYDLDWYTSNEHDWCAGCKVNHVCSECDKVTDDLEPLDGPGTGWPVCPDCKESDQ